MQATGPTAQGAPPPPAGALPLYAPPPPSGPRRSPAKLFGVVVGVMALLAATVFAVTALDQPDGASSPEAAVRQFFDAVANRDALGVIGSLPANERSVLRDPLVQTTQELQRLGILSDFKLNSVPGAELAVENLQLATSTVGKDVVAVKITGGTISGRSIPDALPIGKTLRTILTKDFDEHPGGPSSTFSSNLADGNTKIVTVKSGGGWHVSLGYTIAEAIRGDSTELPDFDAAPAPVGSATPDGAVRDLVTAATALDVDKIVTLMAPDEDQALYDYASLFLPAAQHSTDGNSTKITVSDLKLSVDGSGSTRRVRVGGFSVSIDSSDMTSKISFDGHCVDTQVTYKDGGPFTVPTDGGFVDPSDPNVAAEQAQIEAELKKEQADAQKPHHECPGSTPSTDDTSGLSSLGVLGTASDNFGITVVQIDGRWYVSPVRTVLDTVVETLQRLTPADIAKYGTWWSNLGNGSGTEQFGPVGSAIGGSGTGTSSSSSMSVSPGQSVPLANGAVLNPDGTITKADGTVVKPSDPGYQQLLVPDPNTIVGNSTGTFEVPPPGGASTSSTVLTPPPTPPSTSGGG